MSQVISRPESLLMLRERKRAADLTWILSVLGAFLAVAFPWLVRILEVDLPQVAWSLFGYTLAYAVAAAASDRLRSPRWLRLSIQLLHFSGILYLTILWHLVGGLQNPMFLLVFSLPVVASGILIRGWQPYALAVVSVGTVGLVAVAESPELGWYLLQVGLPVQGLLRILPAAPWSQPSPFPGADVGSSFHFVLLEIFAAAQLAAAALSESLTTFVTRLQERQASAAAPAGNDGLSDVAWRSTPVPSVLVFTDTAQVARASDSFLRQMLLHREDLRGRGLFDLLDLEETDRLRGALGTGGEMPLCLYRVGKEMRIANVHIHPVRHGGDSYACIEVRDLCDMFQLGSALESMEDPACVLGPDSGLRYVNRAAEALLGGLDTEGELLQSLAERRPGGRVEIRGKAYRTRTVVASLPWASEELTILRFSPVVRELVALELGAR